MANKWRFKSAVFAMLVGGLTFFTSSSKADAQQPGCATPVGRIASVEGAVERRMAGSTVWEPASVEQPLCAGDAVRTGAFSRAALALANDSMLRLDQETTLEVGAVPAPAEEPSVLELIRGIIQVFSHRPHSLNIKTPFVNAATEGTEFLVEAEAKR